MDRPPNLARTIIDRWHRGQGSLPPVGAVLELVPARLAGQAHVLVVAEGRPSGEDGRGQDFVDGLAQSPILSGGQAAGGPVEAQTGGVEDLIGVDVAEAGQQVLVEQPGLEWA